MFPYLFDIMCSSFTFPLLKLHWSFKTPPLHIYCATLWEDNYKPHIHDICENFLCLAYLIIFKVNAPILLEDAIHLFSTMGDWYCGDFFTYIKIWGHNSFHLCPRFVLDMMVLEEVAFKTIVEGIHDRCTNLKRKTWTRFLPYMGHSMI